MILRFLLLKNDRDAHAKISLVNLEIAARVTVPACRVPSSFSSSIRSASGLHRIRRVKAKPELEPAVPVQ